MDSLPQHLENLKFAASIAQQAIQQKQWPPLDSIPPDVQRSLLLAFCVLSGTTFFLISRTRRLILETVEAIITIILLLLLIGLVLGMPVGVLYMSYRGVAFLVSSLLTNFPALQSGINTLQQHITRVWERVRTAT